MKNRKPIVIIGAGPAGMGAAIEAARAGASCILIDEGRFPGGQVYRKTSKEFQVKEKELLTAEQTRGKKLHEELKEVSDKIKILTSTSVLGVWKNLEVMWSSNEASGVIEAEQIIIAIGAYERPVPFPGWTLPGVMTVGGVKSFIKTMFVKPGETALIAGTGPLLISTANKLHDIGVNVLAVLEAGSPSWASPEFINQWGDADFAHDIAADLLELKQNNIPILFNHTVFNINGKDEAESVTYGAINPGNWKPLEDTAKTVNADLIALGFGFVPNTELTELAECKHEFYPGIGWTVIRDEWMQTNQQGIFAVGDGARISGAIIAEEEGRIAGIKAALNCDAINADEAEKRLEEHFLRIHSFEKFRKHLNEVSSVKPGLLELATHKTLVCRCEEVHLSEVDKAITEGAGDLQSVKLFTRLGMGACQGKNCSPSMGMYLCEKLNKTAYQVGRINPRPPVKPVTLGALANMTITKDSHQNDSYDAINTGGYYEK